MATLPSLIKPRPMRLHGLSPDQTNACAAGFRPYFITKYGLTGPMTFDDSASGGSLDFSLGAVAFSASGCQDFFRMSIKFMPAPSPWSTGAILPTMMDAMNELTSAMLAVVA